MNAIRPSAVPVPPRSRRSLLRDGPPSLGRRHWLGLASGLLGGAAWGGAAWGATASGATASGATASSATASSATASSATVAAGGAGGQGFIANCWPAHGAVLLMLGAGRRIAATVNPPPQRPWMYVVAPSLHQAVHAPLGGFVLEDLLARDVRLAFVSPADPSAARMAAAGIEVVKTTFHDFASLRECVSLTARILGGDAPARAQAYLAHLDGELAEFARWGQGLSDRARPRVLHIAQLSPSLLVDGSNTIIDEWIRAAGGRNAADGLVGNLRQVSMEQVLEWNPDVIVVAARSAHHPRPPGYEVLDAVRAERVLANPEGVFPWDRYGCEITLQLRWAASRLHPQRMRDDDLPARVQTFYRTFFEHSLGVADARRILAGLAPGE